MLRSNDKDTVDKHTTKAFFSKFRTTSRRGMIGVDEVRPVDVRMPEHSWNANLNL